MNGDIKQPRGTSHHAVQPRPITKLMPVSELLPEPKFGIEEMIKSMHRELVNTMGIDFCPHDQVRNGCISCVRDELKEVKASHNDLLKHARTIGQELAELKNASLQYILVAEKEPDLAHEALAIYLQLEADGELR